MFFNQISLHDKIIKLIVNNPVKYRNTNLLNPYLILSITLFFSRYKSVIVNELYSKGLIELHGDVDLFLKAASAKDTKYLHISASLTTKGMAYYRLNIEKTAPQVTAITETYSISTARPRYKTTLSIVR